MAADERPIPVDPFELKWPKVIGVLALIYAALGMTCSTASGVWGGIANRLPEMFRGGATVTPLIQISTIVQSAVGLALAIMLMVGSVNLLRRRPRSVATLKRWAVLRLGLLLIAAAMLLVTGKDQIALQRSVIEYRNRMVVEGGRPEMAIEKTDQQIWRETLRNAAIGTALQAAFPVFIGLYLGRRRITDQVAAWDAM